MQVRRQAKHEFSGERFSRFFLALGLANGDYLDMQEFSLGWARELFIDVFSVADLYHQDHKSVIMNFINDTVISRPYFVKLVVSLHLCYGRVRKIFR